MHNEPPQSTDPSLHDLRRRLEALERENARLRRQMEPVFGPDNPLFDRTAFIKAMRFYVFVLLIPIVLLSTAGPLLPHLAKFGLPTTLMVGPIRVMDFGGMGTMHPGIGIGLIAFGGLGVGVLAFGGMGIGLIALGGGAVGVVAIGGGALGILALGGGACGYIAIGGNAVGRYALGQNARGKYVFAMNRQDPEAVRVFTRLLPRLKAAVTTPLPVIPLEKAD